MFIVMLKIFYLLLLDIRSLSDRNVFFLIILWYKGKFKLKGEKYNVCYVLVFTYLDVG